MYTARLLDLFSRATTNIEGQLHDWGSQRNLSLSALSIFLFIIYLFILFVVVVDNDDDDFNQTIESCYFI